ncbi:hypothetical protein LF1_58780 [Rubripirellula obstinata]|uniref:Uncharacterized protein n=1 Tax=Rubripirellula obstinata TaxID=406547 RepID=A0A5B1C6X0_9BACT|nr:hypothetical protein LF1_58780 [Rubripirellula obstinata]
MHRSRACDRFHMERQHSDPVMSDVIRLSRGHLLPSSRPAGHKQRTNNTALPPLLDRRLPCGASTDARIPMLNQRRRAGCTAWHQPTPVF